MSEREPREVQACYLSNSHINLAKHFRKCVDRANVSKRALLKLIYVLESEETMMPPTNPSTRHALVTRTFEYLSTPFGLSQADEAWLQANQGDITTRIVPNASAMSTTATFF
jgi:hypothetical protein